MGIKEVKYICPTFTGSNSLPVGNTLVIIDLFSAIRRNNDMNIIGSIKYNAGILHSIIANYDNHRVVIAVDGKKDFTIDPTDIEFYDDITKELYDDIFIDKSTIRNYSRMIYVRNDLDVTTEDNMKELYQGIRSMYDMDNSLNTDTISLQYVRCLNAMQPTEIIRKLLLMGNLKCWIKYECKKDELKARQKRDIVHFTFLNSYVKLLLKYYHLRYNTEIEAYMSTVEADFLIHKIVNTESNHYDNIVVVSKDTDYYTLLYNYSNVYIRSPSIGLPGRIPSYISSQYLWTKVIDVSNLYDAKQYIYRAHIFYGNDYIQPSQKYISLIPLFLTMEYSSIDEYIRIDNYDYYKRYIKVVLLISNCYKIESLDNHIDVIHTDVNKEIDEMSKMIKTFTSRHKYAQLINVNHVVVKQQIKHLISQTSYQSGYQ